MPLNPMNLAQTVPPFKPSESLYAVQYKRNGHIYSYRLSKIMGQFGATQADVEAAAVACDSDPTSPVANGPLKGLIIQTMTPEAQEAVREAYRQKLITQKQKMLAAQPGAVMANPYECYEYHEPFYLAVGDRVEILEEDEEWKNH